jgi:hypothetical protein
MPKAKFIRIRIDDIPGNRDALIQRTLAVKGWPVGSAGKL